MPTYCPYCGNVVKDKDKFCHVCGKPMLTGVPADAPPQDPEEEVPESKQKGKDNKKSKKDEIIEVKKEPEKKVVTLSPEVKQYYEIRLKKTLLKDKLDGFLKSMKGPQYETDSEFAAGINTQVKAVQALVADVRQEEDGLLPQIDEKYIIEKLSSNINEKRSQLTTLSKQYKMQFAKRKMKPEVFNNLREEYKADLLILESNKTDLITALKTWVYELGVEKAKLESEQKILKGRFTSKELKDENEFKEKHSEYSNKIKNLSVKMSTLENFTKK